MTELSRNRNYRLLWTGRALSLFGFNTATVAFPLVTLAVTGSAAASGLVLAAVAATEPVAGLPAGATLDRAMIATTARSGTPSTSTFRS